MYLFFRKTFRHESILHASIRMFLRAVYRQLAAQRSTFTLRGIHAKIFLSICALLRPLTDPNSIFFLLANDNQEQCIRLTNFHFQFLKQLVYRNRRLHELKGLCVIPLLVRVWEIILSRNRLIGSIYLVSVPICIVPEIHANLLGTNPQGVCFEQPCERNKALSDLRHCDNSSVRRGIASRACTNKIVVTLSK